MEVALQCHDGIPDDAVVSIRAGSTRRQAPVCTVRTHPLKFPLPVEACCEPLKIDILQPIASTRLVLQPSEAHYNISLRDANGALPMSLGIAIRSGARAEGDQVLPAEASPAKCKDAAASAREYLEQHGLVRYVQSLLHAITQVRPDDPYDFMKKQLGAVVPRPKSASPHLDQASGAEAVPTGADKVPGFETALSAVLGEPAASRLETAEACGVPLVGPPQCAVPEGTVPVTEPLAAEAGIAAAVPTTAGDMKSPATVAEEQLAVGSELATVTTEPVHANLDHASACVAEAAVVPDTVAAAADAARTLSTVEAAAVQPTVGSCVQSALIALDATEIPPPVPSPSPVVVDSEPATVALAIIKPDAAKSLSSAEFVGDPVPPPKALPASPSPPEEAPPEMEAPKYKRPSRQHRPSSDPGYGSTAALAVEQPPAEGLAAEHPAVKELAGVEPTQELPPPHPAEGNQVGTASLPLDAANMDERQVEDLKCMHAILQRASESGELERALKAAHPSAAVASTAYMTLKDCMKVMLEQAAESGQLQSILVSMLPPVDAASKVSELTVLQVEEQHPKPVKAEEVVQAHKEQSSVEQVQPSQTAVKPPAAEKLAKQPTDDQPIANFTANEEIVGKELPVSQAGEDESQQILNESPKVGQASVEEAPTNAPATVPPPTVEQSKEIDPTATPDESENVGTIAAKPRTVGSCVQSALSALDAIGQPLEAALTEEEKAVQVEVSAAPTEEAEESTLHMPHIAGVEDVKTSLPLAPHDSNLIEEGQLEAFKERMKVILERAAESGQLSAALSAVAQDGGELADQADAPCDEVPQWFKGRLISSQKSRDWLAAERACAVAKPELDVGPTLADHTDSRSTSVIVANVKEVRGLYEDLRKANCDLHAQVDDMARDLDRLKQKNLELREAEQKAKQ